MVLTDYIVIVMYVVGVLSIGFFVKESHLEGYLANSRATKFIPLLLSTTASWVGFVSMAVSPSILATLLRPNFTEKQVLFSIGIGLSVLVGFYPVVGKSVFLLVALGASLPLCWSWFLRLVVR